MPVGDNLKAILSKYPEDKRSKIEAALAEVDEIASDFEQAAMRQADYTKKTQELAEQRKDLQARWETANSEYQNMVAEVARLQSDADSTKAERDAAAQKLRDAEAKLASAGTFDVNKLKEAGVMTKADLEAEIKKVVGGQTAYFGRTLKVLRDHQRLFGPDSDLDPETLIQEAIAAGKTPEAFWAEKYKVDEKRAELAKAAKDAELEKARNEGYQKRLAEEANPATRPLRPSDNPFYAPTDEKQSQWDTSTMTKADDEFLTALQKATA